MSVNVKDLLTATAYDNNGDKVGDVNEVFVDDSSGQPTFVDVNHGLFGMGNSLVPLRGHSLDGDNLTLAYAKDRIKGAPEFDADKPLTPEQQTEIYQHYGVSESSHVDGYTGGERPRNERLHDERSGNENIFAVDPYAGTSHTGAAADTTAEQSHLDGGPVGAAGAGAGAGLAGAGAAGAAASAGTSTNSAEEPAASSNDNTLIRNEEHLNVGTERVETGEARLRKYVVTETETVEVPVSHEEVRVERTPISADEAEAQAKSGGLDANGSEDASVMLHEERPVINKETVPVEKINLSTEEVSDTERVTDEVRKEQIDADGIDSFDDK